MRAHHRLRAAVNLANGSTLAGLGLAMTGRARLRRAPDGLLVGTGYRLPVPPAPAFTMGNVILTKRDLLPSNSALFAHEARHSTQYACCGGLLMLPMYFTAAGASWVLCGDFGAWNVFERQAGLAEGGYPAWPPRPAVTRVATALFSGKRSPRAAAVGALGPGRRRAGHGGSRATACQ
jgi:hypothetical protein